jgi:hypothetical protein
VFLEGLSIVDNSIIIVEIVVVRGRFFIYDGVPSIERYA